VKVTWTAQQRITYLHVQVVAQILKPTVFWGVLTRHLCVKSHSGNETLYFKLLRSNLLGRDIKVRQIITSIKEIKNYMCKHSKTVKAIRELNQYSKYISRETISGSTG